VRLGVASGLVVVGGLIGVGAAQERGVVGETANLAARLQTLAQVGTIVIADSTRRQVGSLFKIEDLGLQPLAGFAAPQQAWRVLGESGVLSRFGALRGQVLTPFIGRDEEIDLLLRRWQRANAGEGQVVLLSGEAGIGKSRLVTAFHDLLPGGSHTRLRYFCSPHHQDSALHPFVAQLERATGFHREDPVETKFDKLEALLAPVSPPAEDVALLAELLSLPSEQRYPPIALSPQRKKDKTFDALIRQLEGLAARQPVLFICEDLHWIDPSSRELLDRTIDHVTRLPVLLVATHRPEFVPPWSGLPQVTTMTLARFDRRAAEAIGGANSRRRGIGRRGGGGDRRAGRRGAAVRRGADQGRARRVRRARTSTALRFKADASPLSPPHRRRWLRWRSGSVHCPKCPSSRPAARERPRRRPGRR
jgi:hypothetical protein